MKRRMVTLIGMLVMGGCTPEWAREGNSQQILLITGINAANDGVPLQSDVLTSSGIVCADRVSVRVENHFKNPQVTNTGFRGDFTIERYEVRYFRSDGRNQEGVDVPYRITGNVSQEVQGGSAAVLSLEVVRQQAKMEPPLIALRRQAPITGGPGVPTLTGPGVVTVFAEITLHARTTTGQVTNSASTRFQIDFADFADNTTTCP